MPYISCYQRPHAGTTGSDAQWLSLPMQTLYLPMHPGAAFIRPSSFIISLCESSMTFP